MEQKAVEYIKELDLKDMLIYVPVMDAELKISVLLGDFASRQVNDVKLPVRFSVAELPSDEVITQKSKIYADKFKRYASSEGLENIAEDFKEGIKWYKGFLEGN